MPQWNPLWLFYHIFISLPPSLYLFLSFSLCPLLFRPLLAHLSLPQLALSVSVFFSPVFLLYSSLTVTLQRVFCSEVTFVTLSPFLCLLLSLEENHTLISLPALFLTSRLARRILTKLLSQLTPKAHNNLLCQQIHSHAHACTLTHTFTCATHAHTVHCINTQFSLNTSTHTSEEARKHTQASKQSYHTHAHIHICLHTHTYTHTLIDCADECGCGRRGMFIAARGSNVERK